MCYFVNGWSGSPLSRLVIYDSVGIGSQGWVPRRVHYQRTGVLGLEEATAKVQLPFLRDDMLEKDILRTLARSDLLVAQNHDASQRGPIKEPSFDNFIVAKSDREEANVVICNRRRNSIT